MRYRRRFVFQAAFIPVAAVLLAGGCGFLSKRSGLPPFSIAGEPAVSRIWSESFDQLDGKLWHEVEVKRRTDYQVVDLEGRRCLRAHSRNAASILVAKVAVDPAVYKWLSWEWRVDRLVDKEALDHKRGSDAAARVYVYFETPGLPWQKHNLDYVWSAKLAAGVMLESAFSDASQIVVAESGVHNLGRWQRVEHNVYEDYRRAFGKMPPPIAAIGVMSDTDNTHSEAIAYFDEMRIGREPFMPSAGRRPATNLTPMEED